MRDRDPIVIVMASDDKYAQHMGVAALSVAARCSAPERLMFYFLDAGISASNADRLRTLVASKGAQCDFIKPDLRRYENFPIRRYGVGTYLRLTMASLLPSSARRLIYLDCDVLAFDDIVPLWNTDLHGKILAAVANLGHQPVSRLELPDGSYFNAGVLVVDMDRWRADGIEERAMGYMNAAREGFRYLDQDALNVVFAGDWAPLRLRWNQQPATYSMTEKQRTQAPHTLDEFEEAVRRPGIVHYLGRNKPWDYMTFHPLKDFYWYYLEQTEWRGDTCRGRSLGARLRKALMVEKSFKRLMRRRLGPTLPGRG